LEDFAPLDLRPSHIETAVGQDPADIIGDAYEYMIGEFCLTSRQNGRFILHSYNGFGVNGSPYFSKPNEEIYDPTCGSASLLIRAAKQAGIHNVAIFTVKK
jgi:type I restriction enzyme M protein